MNKKEAIKSLERFALSNADLYIIHQAINTLIKCVEGPRWIPCNLKLPTEADGIVLISMPNGEVLTGNYSQYSKTWYKGTLMAVGGDDPIAWMCSPESYINQ